MPKTAVAISSSCLDDLRPDTRSVGLLLRLVDQNRGMRREQLRLIFETTQKPGAYRDSRRYRRTTTTQGTSAESVRHQKIFAAIQAVIRYEICCFVPIEILIERRKDLRMTESKCSNCGERCFGELTQPEDSAIVPIHYFIEKKPVCGECYQILRELEQLS